MDLTSHKEHHIIKCLGLAHWEEKCGMSPADREEDLMLLIREHLPETAFSPFALDNGTAAFAKCTQASGLGQKGKAPSSPPPPGCVHCPLGLAWVYRAPHPTTFGPCLCSAPYSIFLPHGRLVALKAPFLPVALGGVSRFSSTPSF